MGSRGRLQIRLHTLGSESILHNSQPTTRHLCVVLDLTSLSLLAVTLLAVMVVMKFAAANAFGNAIVRTIWSAHAHQRC